MVIVKRFSGLFIGIYFLLSFASCQERWDDPIPEGVSLARATLLSELTDSGNILLMWGNFRICNGWSCVQEVEASSYDLFVKWPNSQNFERLVRLSRGTSQYLVDNVRKGKPYEFFIRSNRAGVQVDSNTVMVIPGEQPELEMIFRFDLVGNVLMHPRLSPLGNQVAYVSDVRFVEAGEERRALSLFVWDQATQQHRLLKRNANQPNWSSDGKRLIYATTAGLTRTEQGGIPSHLEIFDLEKEEFSLFSGGLHQQYLPSFSRDDSQVFFYSDSLQSNDFGLWKRDFLGTTSPVFSSFRDPKLMAGMAPFLGLDVSRLTGMVAVDHLQLFNGRPVYQIFGFDDTRAGQKLELMVSQWSDSSPSFSPYDPTKMAFVSDRSGISQVWMSDLVTGELKQITFFKVSQTDYRINNMGFSISWSDGGQALLFPVSSQVGGTELVKIRFVD